MREVTKSRKLSLLALLTTLALILSYLETFIPMFIPGFKVGLPNVVTLVVLVLFGFKEALAIVVLRTSITSVLFTSVSTLMYSLPAGLVSLLVMYFLLKLFKKEDGMVTISLISALAHNLTQLSVAMLVLEQVRVFYLLPYLLLLGVGTGILVGFIAKLMVRFLRHSVLKTKHR